MRTNRSRVALSTLVACSMVGLAACSARPQAPAPVTTASRPPEVAMPAPEPVPPAQTGRADRAPKAGEVEVCGVGIVNASRDDPAGATAIPLVQRAQAQYDLLQMADHAARPRTQAVALTIAARTGEVDGKPMRQESRAALDRLARMARQTGDPVIYALAVDSCRSLTVDRRRGGVCTGISGEQWAKVDPGNAVPWLGLASLAQARQDRKAEAAAMKRAAASRRIEWHTATVADRLLDALPKDTEPSTRAMLAHEARSVGFHLGSVAASTRYCTPEGVRRDAGRRKTCDRLATLMVERGAGLHDIGAAWQIGEALRWPATKVTALRNEVERLDRVITAEQRGTYGTLSCGAIDRQQDWSRRVLAMGEVAAARDLVRSPAHAELRRETAPARQGAAPTVVPTAGRSSR